MIITTERGGINRLERSIAPPMQLAITIPLSIDLQNSMHDGFCLYVALGGFMPPARDAERVLRAIAKAVADAVDQSREFEVP